MPKLQYWEKHIPSLWEKTYPNVDLVSKILISLPLFWEPKVKAIQEAKDLKKLTTGSFVWFFDYSWHDVRWGLEQKEESYSRIQSKANQSSTMRNGSTQKSSASLATNVNEEEEKEVNK